MVEDILRRGIPVRMMPVAQQPVLALQLHPTDAPAPLDVAVVLATQGNEPSDERHTADGRREPAVEVIEAARVGAKQVADSAHPRMLERAALEAGTNGPGGMPERRLGSDRRRKGRAIVTVTSDEVLLKLADAQAADSGKPRDEIRAAAPRRGLGGGRFAAPWTLNVLVSAAITPAGSLGGITELIDAGAVGPRSLAARTRS